MKGEGLRNQVIFFVWPKGERARTESSLTACMQREIFGVTPTPSNPHLCTTIGLLYAYIYIYIEAATAFN